MNIVLTSVHISNTPDAIPLAPALLKVYLETYNSNINPEINILETTVKTDINIFINEILKYKPQILGLSIYLWNKDFYLSLIKEN